MNDENLDRRQVEALFWKELGEELLEKLDKLPKESSTAQEIAHRTAKLRARRLGVLCEELMEQHAASAFDWSQIAEYFFALVPSVDDLALYADCHRALLSRPSTLAARKFQAVLNKYKDSAGCDTNRPELEQVISTLSEIPRNCFRSKRKNSPNTSDKLLVWIDGPPDPDKYTLARRLTQSLGFHFFDAASIFRAITFRAMEKDIPLENEKLLAEFCAHIDVQILDGRVFIDKLGPTEQSRSFDVTRRAKFAVENFQVRRKVDKVYKQFVTNNDAVFTTRFDDECIPLISFHQPDVFLILESKEPKLESIPLGKAEAYNVDSWEEEAGDTAVLEPLPPHKPNAEYNPAKLISEMLGDVAFPILHYDTYNKPADQVLGEIEKVIFSHLEGSNI